jgi:hypothetical protein
MKKKSNIVSRRIAIVTGLTTLGGLIVGGCSRPTPPTYGNLLRMGDNFTYNAQRTLLSGQSLAKEYDFRDISSFPATGTLNPGDTASPTYSEAYEKLHKNAFADWKLTIEGSRTQITRHTCEEGWTAIAQWTGVPLSTILQSVGIKASARFVNLHSYDGWEDSIDLLDAFHPQTILAYGMNGKNLLIQHGAPLRIRVEKQIGYKSMKFLHKIVVTDDFVDLGDSGWAWYNGL